MSDDESQSDGAQELEEVSSFSQGNWRSLKTVEKNELRQRIASWLGENYTMASGVWLLVELVYQHYTHFCSRNGQNNALSQKVFSKILMENFPSVRLSKLGKRGKSFCYYIGLDILESSDEYDSVTKGRRAHSAPTSKAKKTSSHSGKEDPQEPLAKKYCPSEEDTSGDNVSAGGPVTAGRWKVLSTEQKEDHRQAVCQWLDSQYEVSPQICVLRTVVYEHYIDYCKTEITVPAPQAIFGRIIQKKFPSMAMRRLGVRGESKYYYMGIDIRRSSDHYTKISTQRVVCMDSKPKISRFHDGR